MPRPAIEILPRTGASSSAMTRYYPGFLGGVLHRPAADRDRLALPERGDEKNESTQHGKEPFSAEIYLRNATGPLAPYFRELLPDVNGRELLDPTKLKAAGRATSSGSPTTSGSTRPSGPRPPSSLDESRALGRLLVQRPRERRRSGKKYFHDLDQVEATERDPQALSFERERAWDARRSLDADRRTLIGPLVEREQGPARRGRQARHRASRSRTRRPRCSVPDRTEGPRRDRSRRDLDRRRRPALDPARL